MAPPILKRTGQQVSVTRSVNKQVDVWLKKVKGSIKDYSQKDRKRILRKAARPLIRQARMIAPKSAKPHYRYKEVEFLAGRKAKVRIKYNPGNLRRSIKVLNLKKSQDVFVGPKFRGRTDATEYGGPGQPTDGYYAAMIYGSARAFRRKVIEPAAQSAQSEVIRAIRNQSLSTIQQRAKSRGLATG